MPCVDRFNCRTLSCGNFVFCRDPLIISNCSTTAATDDDYFSSITPSTFIILSITTTPPLSPQEQQQQNRLQNVIASTTANLNETEKQVSGIVFTPRWSEPVWINANSVSVLIAYCLPGEFADSGQEILGGFELEVLESYAIVLPQGFMAWMAVVGNQDEENVRLPAALGVICASDLNRPETRVLSPEKQQEINNINQQFINIQNTQITDIDNVINVINNVTTNRTTTEPVTPPPPTNDTGGTPPIECPLGSFYNSTSGQCEFRDLVVVPDTTPPVFDEMQDLEYVWTEERLAEISQDPATFGLIEGYVVQAHDNVDGTALYGGTPEKFYQDKIGGDITIACNPRSTFPFPMGTTTVQCAAVDQAGNVGTYSWTVTHQLAIEPIPPGEIPPIGPREQLEGEIPPATTTEEEPPAGDAGEEG